MHNTFPEIIDMAEEAARLREMRGDPYVPHRRKSGRIDWRYPAGHVRGTATLSLTKRGD